MKRQATIRRLPTGGITPYVWIAHRTEEGFVEFDFALGDPSLYVEMILPEEAFEEFCERNRVVFLTAGQRQRIEREEVRWRYGEEETSERVSG